MPLEALAKLLRTALGDQNAPELRGMLPAYAHGFAGQFTRFGRNDAEVHVVVVQAEGEAMGPLPSPPTGASYERSPNTIGNAWGTAISRMTSVIGGEYRSL